MTRIISTPNQDGKDVSESNNQYGFGYFETQNAPKRKTQEDALAWQTLSKEELTPIGSITQLSPSEIGKRLWTSYKLLDKPTLKAGCTAITTVYDGLENLITATLGDAVAFAVAYDPLGDVIGVLRLNRRIHEPSNPHENERITKAQAFVVRNRVLGLLGVARALGDVGYKPHGVTSNADIDIINLTQLATLFNCDKTEMCTLQIITACDGFTEGIGKSANKKEQEDYLLNALKLLSLPGFMKEKDIARLLVLHALDKGSTDNVSVAVHTITKTQRMMLSLFDGHSGIDAATHAAEYVGNTVKEQCQLPVAEYCAQPMSVENNLAAFEVDNPSKVTPQEQLTTSSTTTASASPSPGNLRRRNAMTAHDGSLSAQSFFAGTQQESATAPWVDVPLDDEPGEEPGDHADKKRKTTPP